uniref:Peptidase M12A domain-containing protein n=1 Tax=Hucho hucho TaxID=62062 RepID=A0A4W5MUI6_9TELE
TTRILEANKGMSQMLMEGDVAVLRTRNAMKCWGNSNYCRWTKSSSGLVEVTCIGFVPGIKLDEFYSHVHTLGIYHEHNRSGRDRYVNINWENYPLTLTDTNDLNTPYDNSSNGKDTITHIPNPSVKIGC